MCPRSSLSGRSCPAPGRRSEPLSKAARPSTSGYVAATVTRSWPESTSEPSWRRLLVPRCDDEEGAGDAQLGDPVGRSRLLERDVGATWAGEGHRVTHARAAHRVQDDVVRADRERRAVGFVGSVDLMSAQRDDVLEVLGERGRRDPGPESERELDGEGADASGGTEHQDVVLAVRLPPWSTSACWAVRPARGRAAASTWVRDTGLGATRSLGTTTYSAAAPSRSKGDHAEHLVAERSGRRSAAASLPSAATTPDHSWDGVLGRCDQVSSHRSSSKVIAAACTATSTSSGPGWGVVRLLHDQGFGPAAVVCSQDPHRGRERGGVHRDPPCGGSGAIE